MKRIGIKKAAELLLGINDIVIFTHFKPDFDTIGSAKALEYALRKIGKRAQFVCPDTMSKRFGLICEELETQIPKFAKVAVCVDMATDVMLGKYREQYKDKILLSIDHHAMSLPFAEYTCCNPKASATGELIYDICNLMQVKLDKTLAEYLYCAVSSDSGCFKYGNTTAKTHVIAAKLLRQGINTAYLNRMMHDIRTQGQLSLEKLALESLKYYADGKIAIMTVTTKMCENSNAGVSDIDALVQLPRTIEGVEVGITIKQLDEDMYKVSVRSNDYFDATKLAGYYGGGGHLRASGFSVSGKLDVLKEEIAKNAEAFL